MPTDSAPIAPRAPHQSIGPYQLVERIGAGGMGEVWSARDMRLDRMVALKFSSSQFSDRSAREARSIAALNHPGICTLYDVGPDYLVMELIEGRTLDQVIPNKGLRINDALRYAVEIADAVAAAHAQGIVHRDLKPSNVMITPRGRVKVLDFGLAKLAVTGSLAAPLTPGHEPATTLAAPETDQGSIVGTIAYMSPEQAQGLPVDARSDIFSFGALLYEMLTGAKAFTGETKVAILAAVVSQEPRPARDLADLPLELDRLLSRCLRKDPDRRPQTMSDLHVALRELKEDSDSGRLSTAASAIVIPAVPRKRNRWLWPAVAVAALFTAAAGWSVLRSAPPAQPAARIIRATNYSGRQADPALSPDGSQLAFSWDGEKGGNVDIYVKLIGQSEALRLTTDPAPDRWPVWSPDGKRIAFRRGDAVYTMSALGGSEHKTGSGLPIPPNALGAGQMSWSPDGKWLAVPTQTGIVELPADGGDTRAATASPGALERQFSPAFSPDGRTLAFFRCGASTVSCRILLQPLGAGGAPAGAPRQLFEKPFRFGSGLAWSRDATRLVFFGSPHQGGSSFLWQVSTSATQPPARLDPNVDATVGGVSIAGERLAFVLSLGGAQVWHVSEGRSAEPLIRSAVWDFTARFSVDGRRIVFESNRAGDGDQIYAANADGSEVVQLTGKEVIHAANAAWSPDGKWLVFQNQREDGNFDIVVMDSRGGPLQRLTTAHNNTVPIFSRDGSRVWFVSNRTGRPEIWNVPVAGGTEAQFTFEGRRAPRESPDGKTLYCLDATSNLYARPTAGGPERRVLSGVVGYAPVDDGIYAVPAFGTGVTPVLHLFDLSGGHDRTVSNLPGYFIQDSALVSLTPDRRTIIYSAYPSVSSVIQMIDGFR